MLVDLSNEKYICDLRRDLRQKFNKPEDDITMIFLEDFCHFTKPMNIFETEQLIYKHAQRELLLTLKTLLDYKLTDKEIANQYELLED